MAKDELKGDKLYVTRDPTKTERANDLLAEEMREATGASEVQMREPGATRPDAKPERPSSFLAAIWDARILIGLTFGAAIVVGAIIATVTNKWWVLVLAVLVHGIVASIVIATYVTNATEVEHPDPSVVGELQEEGVLDPDAELNRRMRGLRDAGGHAEATAEQQESWTPASGDNPPVPGGHEDRVTQGQRRQDR
jgi:hypothetical protein